MIIAIKIGIAIIGVASWLWTQHLLHKHHLKHLTPTREIQDHIHRWTSGINQALNQNKVFANILLILSSLIVDLLGIFLIYQGITGPSLRPLLGLLLLFSLRQLNQLFTSLPTPEGIIWHDPGVPSLLVTYKISNDLFFSGHTALAVFAALEIIAIGQPLLTALAIVIIIFEVTVVLLLRAHWTMDVFTGGLAALWVSEICTKLAPWADGVLASIQ